MTLVIKNLQRAVPLRRAWLRRDSQTLRQILGLARFDLALICVDDQRMQSLNGRYRGQETATDVLSFPFHQDLRAGDIPKPLYQDEYNLGDIFLGVEYIYRQCQIQRGVTFAIFQSSVFETRLIFLIGIPSVRSDHITWNLPPTGL
ncbi:endoribonuclease YbeY-like isoform X3 [Scyliorhinus torazame]|uniref:endoribonuclease YbeY-like isoform X3 n=1 Tax=Scyliorhinus torazame TaxID=75743 RepID=UPI003B59A675